MRNKKSIGIITDPSKTFKIIIKNRVLQVQYDQLSEELRNKKQAFLDFLGGNFQEINTLVSELSPQGNVSIILCLGGNSFVSESSRVSPYELTHPKAIKDSFDFDKWIDGKDALIISLNVERLKEFVDLYAAKILQKNRTYLISTGKVMINELTKEFQEKIIFIERKGVARFGADNRQKILALLS